MPDRKQQLQTRLASLCGPTSVRCGLAAAAATAVGATPRQAVAAAMRKPAPAAVPAELAAPAEVLALPGVFALVEKANLPALSVSAQAQSSSTTTTAATLSWLFARQVALQFPDMFDEVQILERLAYKNKNQHRASKHHQAVCQVRVPALR